MWRCSSSRHPGILYSRSRKLVGGVWSTQSTAGGSSVWKLSSEGSQSSVGQKAQPYWTTRYTHGGGGCLNCFQALAAPHWPCVSQSLCRECDPSEHGWVGRRNEWTRSWARFLLRVSPQGEGGPCYIPTHPSHPVVSVLVLAMHVGIYLVWRTGRSGDV